MGESILDAARSQTQAQQTPVKDALEGAGLLQDVVGGLDAIRAGDWAGGLADYVAAGFDVAGLIRDPLTSALSMGFGWLMEHIGPIKEVLDHLAGNQGALDMTARVWAQIGDRVQSTAEGITDSLDSTCARLSGPAAERYRAWAQDQLDIHVALSDGARGVAEAIDLSKSLLNAVRGLVRGLVADTLAKLVSIMCRYLPPAYPIALATEGLPLIVANTTRATKVVRSMIEAFGRLGKHLGALGEHLTRATRRLDRVVLATDVVWRRRAREAVAAEFTAPAVVARGGIEVAKEGIKYLAPRASATAAGSDQAEDQPAWGDTRAKQERDHRETRVVAEPTATGGLRLTGHL